MSWSDRGPVPRRRALGVLLGLTLTAAGCGFTPVYGPDGTGRALNGSVEVAVSGGIYGFSLGQALQNRFGPPTDPYFRLSYTLSTRSERVAITTAQSTNRYNLIGRSNYQLVVLATGDVVTSGTVDGFSSYSATGSSVATRAASRDAYERLSVILSDKIVARLQATPGLTR